MKMDNGIELDTTEIAEKVVDNISNALKGKDKKDFDYNKAEALFEILEILDNQKQNYFQDAIALKIITDLLGLEEGV